MNPEGLARKVHAFLLSQNIRSLKVAWVSGDDLTTQLRKGAGGFYQHLDIKGLELDGKNDEILAANAYTGQSGILAALNNGADIVICGRCTDASPVMGLASWWHGWKIDEYDKHAGSLMAGHLIECGGYVTGGNYCGAPEIAKQFRAGYPIAEIQADGTSVITKPEHTNGAVTVDTVKAQFLYEIQGQAYLNPDVIAHINSAKIEEIAPSRVRLSNITGTPPPPTTKLAVCLNGGYQAEISIYCAGLEIDSKVEMMKTQVMRELNLEDYTTIDIRPYGTAAIDPRSQAAATVQIRMFVQTKKKEAIEKFKKAIFYNGMQGFCGLHILMDWRTMEPKPFVKYFPALISQSLIPLRVSFVGDQKAKTVDVPPTKHFGPSFPGQISYETAKASDFSSFGSTVRRPLGKLLSLSGG